MDDHNKTPPPNPEQDRRLCDGLDLWDSEASSPPTGLSLIRLDTNECLLIVFTLSMLRVLLHYVSTGAYRGYVHCLGNDCLLCRIGRNAEQRDLLPVYDPLAQTVGVLPISPNLRPHALRPQLTPIFRRLKQGGLLIITIRRIDHVTFSVGTLPVPDGADDGADRIATFLRQLEMGAVDLVSVYPKLDNEELATIPEIATAMRLKGIVLE